MDDAQHIPRHIAIIMDGNGRWAGARGLPRIIGHQRGAAAVRRIVEASCELGVRVLTLYAFSWENRLRPPEEVGELMRLLEHFIHAETPRLLANGIRLRAVGRLHELPPGVHASLAAVMERTAACRRMTLSLALCYGGRQELVDAAREIARRVRAGTVSPEAIDEAMISSVLYAPDLGDPDLLIRTSGEQRLSNFLLWQSSYTELYVTPTLWPDFSIEDLRQAIDAYRRRDRRFGQVETATA
ncbi:MAG: isoprenyl transferase [Candidatus Omnitrophica bacterium]|nr:isoprenyl transferase [Candidatus Omnitrophota bacterium]